jgi:hypothetical protein
MGPPVMTDDRPIITWNKAMRERLRKAFNTANHSGAAQFEFDGYQYLTNYAKYLLEYLDMKLK